MNNPFNSNPESFLEKGQSLAKKAGQVAANQVTVTAQTAVSQITGSDVSTQPQVDAAVQQVNDQKFVDDLYAPSTPSPKPQSSVSAVQATGNGQNPSDQAKLQEARQQLQSLHREYFENEFNKPKPQELPQAEKVEQEKIIEMQELQEKEQKKPNLDLQRKMSKAEIKGGGG